MQRLSEIRAMLRESGLAPRKRLGQSFLIDKNLMGALLDLAELTGSETVLEVGPGTGSLSEELLARSAGVVAVELDRGLLGLLTRRLGDRPGLRLIGGDVMSGKHALDAGVLEALGPQAHLVSNLPYSIATPLIAECLISSWRRHVRQAEGCCRFDRLTFTVQQEVADRLAAPPGGKTYGPVSVLIALLGKVRAGAAVPASAFWPRPKVASRIMRIDFDRPSAKKLADVDMLRRVVSAAFGHRRKQIHSAFRLGLAEFDRAVVTSAMDSADIGRTTRPEQVPAEQYLALANLLLAAR